MDEGRHALDLQTRVGGGFAKWWEIWGAGLSELVGLSS
jgi:hypothetical protein